DFLEIKCIRRAQEIEFLFRDVAEHPDGETGTRERMPGDYLLRQCKLPTDGAHVVLEQLAQRLDQLEFHFLLEAADVVVGLDRHRRATARRERFDHVRIERSLHQEVDVISDIGGGLLENVDEGVANDLSLLFRIFHTGQSREKAFLRVNRYQLDSQVGPKRPLYLLTLVQPQ